MRKLPVANLLLVLCFGMVAFRQFSAQPPAPKGWPRPVYDFRKNPMAKEKIAIGRRLFYDPVLSRDSTVSCASCHLQYTAFAHTDHDLSHGIEGRIGTRNAPSLANLAWRQTFMWDGAVNHLDVLALAPISNKLEMDETIGHVTAKLQRSRLYPALFFQAYGDSVIRSEYVLRCLSQFMLTFVSANARYDQVKRGEAQFTAPEQHGYALFRQHCATCHAEPLFTTDRFENNGLAPDETLNDLGRMKVTGSRTDSLKFKVPSLRNVLLSPPYMHDGRFKNLGQVLNHYIMGVQQSPTLHPSLKTGIYLNPQDKADLVAFLGTLTDRQYLRDSTLAPPR